MIPTKRQHALRCTHVLGLSSVLVAAPHPVKAKRVTIATLSTPLAMTSPLLWIRFRSLKHTKWSIYFHLQQARSVVYWF